MTFIFSCLTNISADEMSLEQVRLIAENKLQRESGYSIANVAELTDEDRETVLARIFHLNPKGYIIVSVDNAIPNPVVSYSFETNFPSNKDDLRIREAFLRGNIKRLLSNVPLAVGTRPTDVSTSTTSWPDTGVGYLTTNWYQGGTYNDRCPTDPSTGTTSYVGCLPVAMGQVMNYCRYPTSASFTSDSDYTTATRGINITATDGNFSGLDYSGGDLSDSDAASLLFACGISLNADYTSVNTFASSGSMHTEMLNRYGYTTATSTAYDNNSRLDDLLKSNLKGGLPAVVGLSDIAHSIVADGYKIEDGTEYYHLNWGWSNNDDAAWEEVSVGGFNGGVLNVSANVGHTTWYCAEGCTRNFTERILLQNANKRSADIKITYMLSREGDEEAVPDPVYQYFTIGAQSRYTVSVNDIIDSRDVSAKIESTNGIGVFVERSMYWSPGGVAFGGAHCSPGVTGTASTWYLAEGSTDGFDTFVLIQNPGTSTAEVTVTYMKSDASTVVQEIDIPAESRHTINVANYVPNEAVSTKVESTNDVGVFVERAMYWPAGGGLEGWKSGHCSTGVTATDDYWYLAEGSTEFFDEYILLQNPGSTTAQVTLTFMLSGGDTSQATLTLDPTSRRTVRVDDYLNVGAVSTKIESADGVGIIAERAMYWDVDGVSWAGGHCSTGVREPNPAWFLAEGTTEGFDEWVLIQNPGAFDAETEVTFMLSDGSTSQHTLTVSASSRSTIHVNDYVSADAISTMVVADTGIIVERAVYSGSNWIDGHDACGTPLYEYE